MLKISQPIITLMSPYLHEKENKLSGTHADDMQRLKGLVWFMLLNLNHAAERTRFSIVCVHLQQPTLTSPESSSSWRARRTQAEDKAGWWILQTGRNTSPKPGKSHRPSFLLKSNTLQNFERQIWHLYFHSFWFFLSDLL